MSSYNKIDPAGAMELEKEYEHQQQLQQELMKDLVKEAPYNPGYEDASFTTAGRKFDGGKLEYGLLPPLALEETVKVLTFGAQKYERDNWQKVPNAKRRYFDALQRHVWSWKQGEQLDPESGIHHLAHAMCCLMFLFEHDIMYSLNNGEVNEAVK